jgi:hypothetical protein
MGRKLFACVRCVCFAGTILAASAILLPTAHAQQVVIQDDHITITYAYDSNGNRKSEVVGTVNPITPSIALTLSATTSNIGIHTSGVSGPYSATSHISATASGGTAPYLYQWFPNQLANSSGANFTLANSGCSTGTLCGAGTAPGNDNDTAILTSSSNCAAGATCTNSATWIVQVTDQAGNSATASVTLRHVFEP